VAGLGGLLFISGGPAIENAIFIYIKKSLRGEHEEGVSLAEVRKTIGKTLWGSGVFKILLVGKGGDRRSRKGETEGQTLDLLYLQKDNVL